MSEEQEALAAIQERIESDSRLCLDAFILYQERWNDEDIDAMKSLCNLDYRERQFGWLMDRATTHLAKIVFRINMMEPGLRKCAVNHYKHGVWIKELIDL